MKKIISILVLVCMVCCVLPISVSAASETEYKDGEGIYYSDSRTKDALDKCQDRFTYAYVNEKTLYGYSFDLNGATIDIYDDLLLDNSNPFYLFINGTIRCHGCRAFTLSCDDICLTLNNITITGGEGDGANYCDNGYGGGIYIDGAGCVVVGKNCTIENCHAKYGGGVGVSGHDCTISGITFRDNKADNNGGTDLYVYWGDCHVDNCLFYSSSPNAYITADTYFDGCNITKNMCCEDVHQVFITNSTASVLSEGALTIIVGVAALVLGLGGGFFLCKIVEKKKKQPEVTDGEEKSGEN